MSKKMALDRLRDISRKRAIKKPRLIETEGAAGCSAFGNIEWPVPAAAR
jgi:hypothetical protein